MDTIQYQRAVINITCVLTEMFIPRWKTKLCKSVKMIWRSFLKPFDRYRFAQTAAFSILTSCTVFSPIKYQRAEVGTPFVFNFFFLTFLWIHFLFVLGRLQWQPLKVLAQPQLSRIRLLPRHPSDAKLTDSTLLNHVSRCTTPALMELLISK